jgi:hypothetical protein
VPKSRIAAALPLAVPQWPASDTEQTLHEACGASVAAREGRGCEAADGRCVGCDEVPLELELKAERLVQDKVHAW